MKLAVLAVAAVVVLSGCSPSVMPTSSALPCRSRAATGRRTMWDVWLGAWIAVLVVFLLVFGLIVYSMIRYRRRSDDEVPVPDPLQPSDRGALHVRPGHHRGGVLLPHRRRRRTRCSRRSRTPTTRSRSSAASGSGPSTTSTRTRRRARTSSTSARPQEPTELWLPVDESVRFNLVSPDVIHSFWVPEFYFKMDVVPGKINTLRHDADPRRRLHRTLRRALRPLPLAHDLQGPRGVARPSTRRTWSSSRTPARQARPRAPRKPTRSRDSTRAVTSRRPGQRRRKLMADHHGGIRRQRSRGARTSAPSARRSSRSSPRPITR